MTSAIEPERGLTPSPLRPSPWGLALLLPVYAFLWLFRLTDTPILNDALVLGVSMSAYVTYVRLWEHRPVRELRGGAHSVGEASLGVAMGVACFAVMVGATLITGVFSLAGLVDGRDFSPTLVWMAFLIAVAVFEELLFRGIILRYLELWLGSWLALVLSSLVFALAHFLGGPQPPEVLAERVATGVLCGAAFLLTRRLWMPMGIHLGVNVGSALAFGWDGVATQILVLVPRGNLTWVNTWRVVVEMALAALLLLAALRRGRIVGASEAWRTQSGETAQVRPATHISDAPSSPKQ